jgi:Cu(I)/Ag(I) efflux system membrane protein CusA/SilA
LPVLTSTGRGADIMVPMAIPTFGGMAFALVSIFIVPVIYCMREENRIKRTKITKSSKA